MKSYESNYISNIRAKLPKIKFKNDFQNHSSRKIKRDRSFNQGRTGIEMQLLHLHLSRFY